MKKITLLLTLLSLTFGYSQSLPIDFETSTTWVGFGGGEVTTISNPVSNTDNNSAQVGQMVKSFGELYGGSFLDLSSNMDFNNNNTFSLKAYSIKANTKVLLKVEDSNDAGVFYQIETTMSTINNWETLVFDYAAIPSNTYDRLVIIFDNGTMGDGSANFTYYFDDISLYNNAPPACTAGGTGNPPGETDYALVWADEFSDDGPPCFENWGYDIGAGGWGNGESQYYTSSINNAFVQSGVLTIKAIKENFNGSQYTSARLLSKNKYEFTHGKIDIRAKVPTENGTWSALWMLGADFPNTPWPAVGEIDIMEHTGNNENVILGTTHNNDGFGGTANGGSTAMPTPTAFHNYSITWDENEIKFFVDEVQFYAYNPSPKTNDNYPYNNNFFMIMNIAMGGTLGGSIDPLFTEATMEVDYVRVYQKEAMAAAPTPTVPAANVISMFSDAYTDVPVDTWNTTWSQATLEDITLAGNPTKKYTNLGFNGTETITNGSINATAAGMMYFHMDVWSPNSEAFRVKLVDFLGDGFEGANGDTEAELTFILNKSTWNAIDIPLSDFTTAGMTSFTDISQLIISSDPFGTSTVFVDNVYYATEATLSTISFDISEPKVFPNPTDDLWTIKAKNQIISSVQLYDILGKQVMSQAPYSENITIDASALKSGVYFAKIETTKGSKNLKLIKQ